MNLLEKTERRGGPLRPPRRSIWPPRRLSLALQGGGSFGAFTWGVLDRLLEEESMEFDTVSGASAGAFNAVVLATALAEGDRQLARERLERFWWRISQSLGLNPLGTAARFVPGAAAGTLSFWTSFLSPYQFNPLDLNPMRSVLNEVVNFESLRHPGAIPLLLAATRVSDGRARVFRNAEIDAETVLASASLPLFHHAVKIDDEAYWDGGYSANPPLLDLAMASSAPDILVVQVTPMREAETPMTSHDIIRRLGHITFNASLLREMAALDHLAESNRSPLAMLTPMGRKFRRMRQHHIAAEEVFTDLPNASELNVSWEFLLGLRARGRDAAEAWLAKGTAESTALPETKSWLAVLDAAVKAQRKPLFAYIGERWHRLVAEYRSKFRSKDAPKKAPKLFRQPAPPVRPFSA
ncbi:MAG: patatin-like phospholipase family protein [Beijerinckiaceae bacterium]